MNWLTVHAIAHKHIHVTGATMAGRRKLLMDVHVAPTQQDTPTRHHSPAADQSRIAIYQSAQQAATLAAVGKSVTGYANIIKKKADIIPPFFLTDFP